MYLKIEMYANDGLNNIGFSKIKLLDKDGVVIPLVLSDLISHTFNTNTQGLLSWLNDIQTSTIPYSTKSSAEFTIKIPKSHVEYTFDFYNWLNNNGMVKKVNILFSEDGINFFLIKEQQLNNTVALSLTSVTVLAKEIYRRLTLKNPTTNQHYSLSDKTLISLPDASVDNIIKYGIEAGKEVKLDGEFNKQKLFVIKEQSTILGAGILYEHILTMDKSFKKIY